MHACIHEAQDVGAHAAWRTQLLSHFDCLCRIRARNKPINSLLQLPLFSVPDCCRMDWLHVADQGVAADLAGNLFWFLVHQRIVPGPNIAARVSYLNTRLQDWYERRRIDDRIDLLHPNRFWDARKLRCSAACMRSMVPFCKDLAEELLGGADASHAALLICCRSLHECYMCLDERSFAHAQVARDESIKFALQWMALHRVWYARDEKSFKLKPKLHLFLHICSDGSRPRRYWAYRDEDYGGAVSRRGRRRGGVLSVHALSRKVLERFWIQSPTFRLV